MTLNWNERTLSGGIHIFTGSSGTTVVLLPGWPETAEAYSEVFTALTERHRVLAVDPPGLGDSTSSAEAYDTGSVAKVLADALQTVAPEGIHLVGHDVGGWIAYAWAAQFPEQIKSLTLLDTAIPGLGARQDFPLPYELNLKLWQFSFNTLPDLPEALTVGAKGRCSTGYFNTRQITPSASCKPTEGATSNATAGQAP